MFPATAAAADNRIQLHSSSVVTPPSDIETIRAL